MRTGLALEAEINLTSVFDRKNYFYPDLPPGYQISQFSRPIVGKGRVVLDLDDGSQRTIGITRLHLEMDAGKSIHDRLPDATCVDLNRAGIALMEIVSEPDIRSPEEAGLYLRKLRSILRYIGTCDGNMEQGSLRADVNVSVRRPGGELGTRCEVKNLNSVRFVMRAIEIEAERQVAVLEDGGAIELETRLFDAERGETRPCGPRRRPTTTATSPIPTCCRSPSTPPGWRPSAPGCPSCPTPGRRASCGTMASRPTTPACSWRNARSPSFSRKSRPAETASRWPTGSRGTLFGALNRAGVGIEQSPVSAAALGALIDRVRDGTVSNRAAKDVFEAMVSTGKDADTIIEEQGLRQVSDTGAIEALVDQVIADNPDKVADYRGGKTKLMGWFVGQVMKASGGKANPKSGQRGGCG